MRRMFAHLRTSSVAAMESVMVAILIGDAAMRAEITSGNQEMAKDGFAPLRNRPGFGIDVDERALDRYSEERV